MRKKKKSKTIQGQDDYGIVDVPEKGVLRVVIRYRLNGRKITRKFPINFTDVDPETGEVIALTRLDMRVIELEYKGKRLGKWDVRDRAGYR